MEGILTFDTIAKAMSKGRQAVKENFSLEEGTEGNTTEEEKNYIHTFNSNWAAKLLSFWLHASRQRGCQTQS